MSKENKRPVILLISRVYGVQSGLTGAVEWQSCDVELSYGMRDGESFCTPRDGCDRVIEEGDFAAAIVDDDVMSGLTVVEIIRALSAKNIPCIALTSTGHDHLSCAQAGALKVIYRGAIVDALYDQKISLLSLRD